MGCLDNRGLTKTFPQVFFWFSFLVYWRFEVRSIFDCSIISQVLWAQLSCIIFNSNCWPLAFIWFFGSLVLILHTLRVSSVDINLLCSNICSFILTHILFARTYCRRQFSCSQLVRTYCNRQVSWSLCCCFLNKTTTKKHVCINVENLLAWKKNDC